MTKTSVIRTKNGQSVRLPKHLAFPDTVSEVVIIRDGPRRIIVPANATWDDFFANPGVDLGPRDQPAIQDREQLA